VLGIKITAHEEADEEAKRAFEESIFNDEKYLLEHLSCEDKQNAMKERKKSKGWQNGLFITILGRQSLPFSLFLNILFSYFFNCFSKDGVVIFFSFSFSFSICF
jgi:hypothetical protein